MRVTPIELGTVQLPDWHPRAAGGTCPIRVFAVEHPDGVMLVDTGPADDHETINEWYAPDVRPIVTALNAAGIDERDVAAIVNSHLHFDHCGQNSALPRVPVWVQREEVAAAEAPHYTVAEWAAIAPERARILDGDAELAAGVTILSTPGHTPGHQSVLVDADGRRELIVGQACYLCSDFEEAVVPSDNLHDESWADTAAASIRRLVAVGADAAHFSHDLRMYARDGQGV
ncbi:MAG: N-acyl homoserine lactonase family protein [Acidimicrobiia bacterium]|nr:N-acyl homoserine lactonase family protein [Acidimicrobiia bacterium]